MNTDIFNRRFSNGGPTPPCGKHCPDRAPGCSVTCEKWLAYVKERNENYKKRLKNKEAHEPTDKGLKMANRKVGPDKNRGRKKQ